MGHKPYEPGPDWVPYVKGTRRFMLDPGRFNALELLDDGTWRYEMAEPVMAEGVKVPREVGASWTRRVP